MGKISKLAKIWLNFFSICTQRVSVCERNNEQSKVVAIQHIIQTLIA